MGQSSLASRCTISGVAWISLVQVPQYVGAVLPAEGRFRRTSLTAASRMWKGLPGTLGVRAIHSSPVLSCSPTFGQKTCRDISSVPVGSPVCQLPWSEL